MAAVVRLISRRPSARPVPAQRIAEAGCEVTALAGELRSGLEEMARHSWACRDPWGVRKVSLLLPKTAALETTGRMVAGWADKVPACPDGIAAPAHGAGA